MNLKRVLGTLKSKDYKVFKNPYELNIVGIRNSSTVPNSFDDTISVFYKDDKDKWVFNSYPATTDTGTYWLKNPMGATGSALLKEGQFINSHKIGLHRGKYTALVQQNPVTVFRDYNRDSILDFNNGREETGQFGINIHHASNNGTTKEVDKYSAGCQVFSNIKDFDSFMEMAEKHKEKNSNNFTYTLIDERSLKRTYLRRSLYFALFSSIIVGGIIFYIKKIKK